MLNCNINDRKYKIISLNMIFKVLVSLNILYFMTRIIDLLSEMNYHVFYSLKSHFFNIFKLINFAIKLEVIGIIEKDKIFDFSLCVTLS